MIGFLPIEPLTYQKAREDRRAAEQARIKREQEQMNTDVEKPNDEKSDNL